LDLTHAVRAGLFANVVALSALSVLSQWLLKPAVMLMAVINSIALYFIVVYGGVLDKTMMGNVVNTDFAEASALFHPMLLVPGGVRSTADMVTCADLGSASVFDQANHHTCGGNGIDLVLVGWSLLDLALDEQVCQAGGCHGVALVSCH
jgi:hypothetical protein